MTKEQYAEYLQSPHWQATRTVALERAQHRCQLCNATKALQVHHRTYERLGREDPADLTVLCRLCHQKHHNIAAGKKPKSVPSATVAGKKQARDAARQRILIAVRAAGRPLTILETAELAGVSRSRAAGLIGALVGDKALKRRGKRIAIPGTGAASALASQPSNRKPNVVLSETQKRRAAVREVFCSYCCAKPGQRCRDRNELESEGNHPARVEAALRARNGHGGALV